MIIIPVVALVGTVVTGLTVLTVGVVAVVGDSVVNVVGLLVLSTTHTHTHIQTLIQTFRQTRYEANQKKHFVNFRQQVLAALILNDICFAKVPQANALKIDNAK